MIILDQKFIAMWYFQVADDIDFMGGLTATQEPVLMNEKQDVTFEYRFRYYKDNLTGLNSEDDKHWYLIRIREHTPQYGLDHVREIVQKVAGGLDARVTEILMDEKGIKEVVRKMKALPMFHMSKMQEGTA